MITSKGSSASPSGVTPGTYGTGDAVPALTIDELGRVTSAVENQAVWGILRDENGITFTSPDGNFGIAIADDGVRFISPGGEWQLGADALATYQLLLVANGIRMASSGLSVGGPLYSDNAIGQVSTDWLILHQPSAMATAAAEQEIINYSSVCAYEVTQATEFSFVPQANFVSNGAYYLQRVIVRQDNTGGHAVTFAGVVALPGWPGVSTTANDATICRFLVRGRRGGGFEVAQLANECVITNYVD